MWFLGTATSLLSAPAAARRVVSWTSRSSLAVSGVGTTACPGAKVWDDRDTRARDLKHFAPSFDAHHNGVGFSIRGDSLQVLTQLWANCRADNTSCPGPEVWLRIRPSYVISTRPIFSVVYNCTLAIYYLHSVTNSEHRTLRANANYQPAHPRFTVPANKISL